MKITVIPKSKKFGVFEREGKTIVKVRAPPEKGKANAEVEKELSRLLGTRVCVCKGLKSREKQIIADGISDAVLVEIVRKLAVEK